MILNTLFSAPNLLEVLAGVVVASLFAVGVAVVVALGLVAVWIALE